MTILDKITTHKKQEIASSKISTSIEQLKDTAFYHRKGISLKKTLADSLGIIAEFKRKSPSKGIINPFDNAYEVVSKYEKHGASAISILTDTEFFGGKMEDISNLRDKVSLPILRKEFMVDAYQFYEAKAIGADIVLLIAACLTSSQVSEFTELAHEIGLEVLLELHTEDELKHYNQKIDYVGINNRNLKNFQVDLEHSVALKNSLPTDCISVAESGIDSLEDYFYLKNKGFNAFLMGSHFMEQAHPGLAFEIFVQSLNEVLNK